MAIFKQVAVETVGRMRRKLRSHIVERKDVQDKIHEKKQLKNLWGIKRLLRIWREKTQGRMGLLSKSKLKFKTCLNLQ